MASHGNRISDVSKRLLVSLNVFPAPHLPLEGNRMLWIDSDGMGVN